MLKSTVIGPPIKLTNQAAVTQRLIRSIRRILTYFENGIRGHMKQMSIIDEKLTIEVNDINEFVQSKSNEFMNGNEFELINNQYWIASIWNAMEAWANFQRSEFLVLCQLLSVGLRKRKYLS